ncbi:unannotated protein [freshwater metagenome]|uniref:Unannotated protein n=1 Tax=freshwater metagenome TaxID=449393 RepID=A0A6J7LJL7_9ZZZZ
MLAAVADMNVDTDGSQGIESSRVLRIAPGDLNPARDEDPCDPGHPGTPDADDVNPAQSLKCVAHPHALRADAIPMTVRASCSSASRTPCAAAAAAMEARRS